MIRLKSLLAEISLGSVTPYATSFVWRDQWRDGDTWETEFEAVTESRQSHQIKMVMQRWRTPVPDHDYEYQFAYFTRSADQQGWTTSTSLSGVKGQLSVLRLLRTIGEAIGQFAAQTGATVIDITGADTSSEKGDQKSRIYSELIASNPELSKFEARTLAGKLYLIHRDEDVEDFEEDEPDFWDAVPDGSEET